MKLGSRCVDKKTGKLHGTVVRLLKDKAIGRSPDGRMFEAVIWAGNRTGNSGRRRASSRCLVTIVGHSADRMPAQRLDRNRYKIDDGSHPIFGGAVVSVKDPDVQIEEAA